MVEPVIVREMPPGDDRIQIRIETPRRPEGPADFASIYVSPSTALRLLASLEAFFSDARETDPPKGTDAA